MGLISHALCPVRHQHRATRDQDHAEPVRQCQSFAQEQHGEERDEDDGELVALLKVGQFLSRDEADFLADFLRKTLEARDSGRIG